MMGRSLRPSARRSAVHRCSRVALVVLLLSSFRAQAGPASADSDWQEGRLPASVREGTPRKGGTLVVRIDQEPPSLDKLTDSSLAIDWMLERKGLETMAEPDSNRPPWYTLQPAL